jgi:Tol biopolymer transport system component
VPIFETDGTGAYFLSRRPLDGDGEPDDYNVWYADKHPDGWGPLTPIGPPLDTPDNEYPYSVSSSGTLYLQGKYEDTLGDFDIYYSRLVDGSHEQARNLGAPVNTEFSEGAPFVAPDEIFIVYSSYGEPDNHGSIDLYVTFRSDDGTWSPGINLGPEVNSSAADKFPSLSPDGNYLFFVSHRGADRSYVFSDMTYDELMQRNLGPRNGEGDVYWVSAGVILRLRPR